MQSKYWFDFSPKLIAITYSKQISTKRNYANQVYFIYPEAYSMNYEYVNSDSYYQTVTIWDNNNFTWYVEGKGIAFSANSQLNAEGVEYQYITIG